MNEVASVSDHFRPVLPGVIDSIRSGVSDRGRIEQAYAIVSAQLSPEERERYDLEVMPYLISGEYNDFLEASDRNHKYLPRGDKPRIKCDRRRKRAMMNLDVDFSRCPGCGAVVVDEHVDGEGVACDCGLEIRGDEECFELGYKERENYEYRTNSIYKRPNHLQEVLLQLQGMEKKPVEREALDRVREEARKYRIDVSKITMAEVRTILERLSLPKLYEHSAQIVHTLSGRPPIIIPEEVEARIKRMFNELMPVFEENKGKRRNFLSYTFAILKILEIIGEEDLVQAGRQMKMLKSKSKVREQDEVWRKICRDLNWPYFETRI